MISTPDKAPNSIVDEFLVSRDKGMSKLLSACKEGITLKISSFEFTFVAPGLVDSPPTSI